MRDGRLGPQSGVDQSFWRWSLRYTIGAGTTGIFGATGDDDTELRRNDVQPLGHLLPDAMQNAATVADQAIRLDECPRHEEDGREESLDWSRVLWAAVYLERCQPRLRQGQPQWSSPSLPAQGRTAQDRSSRTCG